jgi:DNA-binding cell septation regulator SpoVG
MKLVFVAPPSNAPAKLLANVTIKDCPIPGIEMRDVGVWDSDKGPWVAFPGRQYEKDGKKKTVRCLNPMGDDWSAMNKFTEGIIAKFREWLKEQDANEPGADDGDEENPFA